MLTALADLPRAKATEVLASAARTLLPEPRIAEASASEHADMAIVHRVLSEARKHLKVGDDDSAATVRRLASFLARELSSAVIPEDEIGSVRGRLGAKGLLANSQYQIIFTSHFDQSEGLNNVRRSHVQSAIAHADMTEHILPTKPDTQLGALTSLFFQTPPVKKGVAYSLLIKCDRADAALFVQDAFRIYHDEVNLAGATSAGEVLARFLEKFGLDIDLNGERARFFRSKVIHGKPGDVVTLTHADGTVVRHKIPDDGRIELALAYSVSDAAYAAQLVRHGIRPTMPGGSRTVATTRYRAR